jgi:tRNA threonylcarbamoyl adenosine modification protein YjeE
MRRTLDMQTTSPEATEQIAHSLGLCAAVGDIFRLHGELGAGKTAFTRGLAAGLGHDSRVVSSPTFVVVNRYDPTPSHPGAIPLVHVDAYRLSGDEELDTLGWDRVIDDMAVVAIEWPQRIEGRLATLPRRRIVDVSLEHIGQDARSLRIELDDGWQRRPGFGRVLAIGQRLGALPDAAEERIATICPITGGRVAPDCPSWPFATEHARLADLHRWLTGGYVISRELTLDDQTDQA